MKYVLDTNVVSSLTKGDLGTARAGRSKRVTVQSHLKPSYERRWIVETAMRLEEYKQASLARRAELLEGEVGHVFKSMEGAVSPTQRTRFQLRWPSEREDGVCCKPGVRRRCAVDR